MARLRLLLLTACLLAYANALGGPFVFDDRLTVVDNPNVRSLWPLDRALWAPPEAPVSGRPIPALSFALGYAAFGLDPVGYKATNLALHLLCALALFELVRQTLRLPVPAGRFAARADVLAFASALLWSLHPLASECVDYITQRTESFMVLFLVLTLVCTALGLRAERGSRWLALGVVTCAAGMASKQSMVVAPLLVALYDRSFSGAGWRSLLWRRAGFYAGLVACWIGFAALVAASWRTPTIGSPDAASAWSYLWNQSWVIVRYLWLVVWPHPLAFDWGVPRPLELADVLGSVAAVGALAVGALVLWLRRPALGFPLIAVFVLLAPTSSVVPILTEVGAERRMYGPSMALVVAIVLAGDRALRAWLGRDGRSADRVAAALLAAAALALGLATARHNSVYRSELRLWEEALAAFPDNARAHASLGQVQARLGDIDVAIEHYRDAISLDPDYAEAHNELGVALAGRGDVEAGLAHFERAIEAAPMYPKPYLNRALALLERGDRVGARRSLREALRLDPAYDRALLKLAWMLATDPDPARRNPARALVFAERAVALEGDARAGSLDVLAAACAAAGDFARATDLARRAQALALAQGDPAAATAYAARLAHYRRGEAWVDSAGTSR